MFMRFRGGGIGHKSTQERTQVFEQQSHILPPEDDEAVVDGVDSGEEPEESEEENDEEELSGDEDRDDEICGGEDGEEPWDENEVEAEGYAQF
jgi:hypothetical protein